MVRLMEVIDLNHVALHVEDVERSLRFYRDQLGLSLMPRPAFSFPGAWLRLGAKQELHLIGDRVAAVSSHKRGTHFALQVPCLETAWKALESRGVDCFSRQTRPDGALQFYVTDPDGHVIEFCQVTCLS